MAGNANEGEKSDTMSDCDGLQSNPVLHVLVIGFHHRKGCQVEYSWPPLIPENDCRSPNLPSQWKHLPSIALPDGAHNYDADTCFFHLPDLENPRKTIFGISCYRQIDASKLVNKTADITRTTVQKSVCVLSRLPLYGQIQVKMQLITEAYFREGDFDRLDLIHQTYDNLNSCLNDDMCHTQQLYVGLRARAFVQQFKERSLVLFKLLLLERKVLLFQSPVVDLTSFLLTLLSLHPGMLEGGLDESACVVPLDTPPLSLSPDCDVTIETSLDKDIDTEADPKTEEEEAISPVLSPSATVGDIIGKIDGALSYLTGSSPQNENECISANNDGNITANTILSDELKTSNTNQKVSQNGHQKQQSTIDSGDNSVSKENCLSTEVAVEATENAASRYVIQQGVESDVYEFDSNTNFTKICNGRLEEFGLPLKIFTGGNLCHPYVSLTYLDTLTQPSVHGYTIGATNDLFLHRKGLTDVIIKKVEGDYRLDIQDQELKKALHLTTEDLRFTDYLIRHVCDVPDVKSDEPDVFLDGIGWEGGDEWVRAQFRFYIVCLLRTVINIEDPSQSNHFNPSFIQMWKKTKNYRAWRRHRKHIISTKDVNVDDDALQQIIPGHPYAGMSKFFIPHDISLHVKNAMQNTESGKRVSKAVASTGQAVSKGLSSAKSTLSSLFSSNKNPTTNEMNDSSPGESNDVISKSSSKTNISP